MFVVHINLYRKYMNKKRLNNQSARVLIYIFIKMGVFIYILLIIFIIFQYVFIRFLHSQSLSLNIILTLLYRMCTRKQGCLYGCDTKGNKVISCMTRINEINLKKYKELCCYGDKDEGRDIPVCYMEMMFQKLLIKLVLSEDFRLSPLGLIHIKQTMTQHSNLNELFDIEINFETQIEGYRSTTRGVEADIHMWVRNVGDMCVWEGVLTLLSRSTSARKSGMKSVSPSLVNKTNSEIPDTELSTLVTKVTGDTGLRYAQLSGDWNPHHLFSWTARLLGYKAPIAHGMWTLARALAEIKKTGVLEEHFQVTAEFKRPLFMPGEITVSYQEKKRLNNLQDDVYFNVQDSKTKIPHLTGHVIFNASLTDG